MKEYLKHAIQIEMLMYEQQMAVDSLKGTISKLKNYEYDAKWGKSSFWNEFNIGTIIIMFLVAIIVGAIGGYLVCLFNPPNLGLYSTMSSRMQAVKRGTFPYMKRGALVCSLIVVLFLIIKVCKIIHRNRKNMQKNAIIEQSNQRIYAANIAKIQNLTQELEAATNNLQKTNNIRTRFYNRNLIHPKYRNLVAVCSFYEYFDTGRCNTLTGHEGAYNIYEQEIRLNRIIGQLEVVIANLNEIRNTQYELFCAVDTCNRNISNMNGYLQSISATSQQIAETSAITAYNTRIAAKNTEEMKWLMYFR